MAEPPSSDKQFQRPSGRSLTYRLQNIPAAYGEQVIKDALTAHGSITQYSFARVDDEVACATVTFKTPSPSFKEAADGVHHTIDLHLPDSDVDIPVTVDTSFIGITTLYNPELPTVDIVAVNGLGGHAIGSWQAPTGNDVWLRDYLWKDVPDARILAYGYPSTVAENDSKSSIGNLASDFLENLKAYREDFLQRRRPLILIAHSLGGLLVKEALVIASKHLEEAFYPTRPPENSDLFKSCYALVFFGVPNLGLRHEQLKTIVNGQPNEELIRSLVVTRESEPSQYLERLHTDFQEAVVHSDSPMVVFFETKPTKTVEEVAPGVFKQTGPPCLMVTTQSATTVGHSPQPWNHIPIEGDHRNMVKFFHKLDPNYVKVKARLKSLVAEAAAAVEKRFSPIAEIKKLLKSLSRHDLRVALDTVSSQAQETGWILNSDQYQLWRSKKALKQKQMILWYSGRLDTDFRLITEDVTRDVSGKTGSASESLVVDIFCGDLSKDKTSVKTCSVKDVLIRAFSRIIQQNQDVLERLDFEQQILLLRFCQQYAQDHPVPRWGPVYYVLLFDLIGLCPVKEVWILIDSVHAIQPEIARIELLEELKRFAILPKRSKSLRIFLTSLPFAPIATSLTGCMAVDSSFEANDCLISLGEGGNKSERRDLSAVKNDSFDWAFSSSQYQRWTNEKKLILLWLTGKAGSGKSTLLKTLLEKKLDSFGRNQMANSEDTFAPRILEKSETPGSSAEPISIFAHFFYDEGKELQSKSHSRMLRSILFQILSQDKRLFPPYRAHWKEPSSVKSRGQPLENSGSGQGHDSQWSFDRLLQVFRELRNTGKTRYRFHLYLDAFDLGPQSEQRESLLQAIQGFDNTLETGNQLKIIITSRSCINAPSLSDTELDMNVEDGNQQTIVNVVDQGLAPIQAAVETLSQEERAYFEIGKVRDSLLHGADGMVLWVALVLKQLELQLRNGLITPRSMILELEKLQGSLHAIYKSMVAQLSENKPPEETQTTKKWLSWVSCSRRHLTLEEFRDASLVVNIDETFDGTLDELRKQRMIISNHNLVRTYLATICGPFVELKVREEVEPATVDGADLRSYAQPIPKSGDDVKQTHASQTAAIVQLSHHTVRKFLADPAADPYTITELNGNDVVVRACIRYLEIMLAPKRLFGSFSNGAEVLESRYLRDTSDFEAFSRYLDQNPLFSYIFCFFDKHLAVVADQFHDAESALQPLSSILDEEYEYPDSCISHLLMSWSLKILESGQQPLSILKDVDRTKHAALATIWQQYVLKSHAAVIEHSKAASTRFLTKVFISASRNGHHRTATIMQVLGISTDMYDDLHKCYALEAVAASLSPPEVFENFSKSHQPSQVPRGLPSLPPPMPSATQGMKLLEGPSPSSNNDLVLVKQAFMASPLNQSLLAAARASNLANIKVLLTCGAAPDSRGFSRESCVHIAAWKNRPDIIEVLVQAGADINSADYRGSSPLHVAAIYGSTASAENLLKLGALTDLRNEYMHTALDICRQAGHEDLVELLTKFGAKEGDRMPPNFAPFRRQPFPTDGAFGGFAQGSGLDRSHGAPYMKPIDPTMHGGGPKFRDFEVDSRFPGHAFQAHSRPTFYSAYSDISSGSISPPATPGADHSSNTDRAKYVSGSFEHALPKPRLPPFNEAQAPKYHTGEQKRVQTPSALDNIGERRRLLSVPSPAPCSFLGRDRDMDFICQYYDRLLGRRARERREYKPLDYKLSNTFIIDGLVGVGKTELAIQFIHYVSRWDRVSVAFWVNAQSISSMRESFTKIGLEYVPNYLTLEEKDHPSTVFTKWLEQSSLRDWVLIIDGLDDPRMCEPGSTDSILLPKGPNGMVLITTRNSYLSPRVFVAEYLTLRPLDPLHIRKIFSEATGGDALLDPNFPDCGGLPGALTLLHSRTDSSSGSLADARESLQSRAWPNRDDLIERMVDPMGMVLEQLRLQNSVAAQLISLLSCLDPGRHSTNILYYFDREGALGLHSLETFDMVRLKVDGPTEQNHLTLHPLVRVAERMRLFNKGIHCRWQARACDVLLKMLLSLSSDAEYDEIQYILKNAEYILLNHNASEHMETFMGMDEWFDPLTRSSFTSKDCEGAATLLHKCAWEYFCRGYYALAFRFVCGAVIFRWRIYSAEHLETRRSRFLYHVILSYDSGLFSRNHVSERPGEDEILEIGFELSSMGMDLLDGIICEVNDRDERIRELESNLRKLELRWDETATGEYSIGEVRNQLEQLRDERKRAMTGLHPKWNDSSEADLLRNVAKRLNVRDHFNKRGSLHVGYGRYITNMDQLRDLAERLGSGDGGSLDFPFCFDIPIEADIDEPPYKDLLQSQTELDKAGVQAVAFLTTSRREIVTMLRPLTPYERRHTMFPDPCTPVRFPNRLASLVEMTYPLYDEEMALTLWKPPISLDDNEYRVAQRAPLLLTVGSASENDEPETILSEPPATEKTASSIQSPDDEGQGSEEKSHSRSHDGRRRRHRSAGTHRHHRSREDGSSSMPKSRSSGKSKFSGEPSSASKHRSAGESGERKQRTTSKPDGERSRRKKEKEQGGFLSNLFKNDRRRRT